MTPRTARRALVALADAATELGNVAAQRPMRSTARQARKIAATLNSAVTRLDDDGTDYLDAAEAFITAGADSLTDIACVLGGAARVRA